LTSFCGHHIIGAPIGCNSSPLPKVVDLDPEQQMVSEIWGMQAQLGPAGGGNSFTGDFLRYEPQIIFLDSNDKHENS
jgi:hypothetical protein